MMLAEFYNMSHTTDEVGIDILCATHTIDKAGAALLCATHTTDEAGAVLLRGPPVPWQARFPCSLKVSLFYH